MAPPKPANATGVEQGAAAPHADMDVEAQVLAAQSALLLHRARPSNLVTSLVGVLVCWILWDSIDHGWLIAGALF